MHLNNTFSYDIIIYDKCHILKNNFTLWLFHAKSWNKIIIATNNLHSNNIKIIVKSKVLLPVWCLLTLVTIVVQLFHFGFIFSFCLENFTAFSQASPLTEDKHKHTQTLSHSCWNSEIKVIRILCQLYHEIILSK